MRETHLEDGKWWVSPYNFEADVRGGLNLPPKVEIHDATLRDGEQTPGVVFSIDDKIEIATKLDELGVERIEAGMPAVSEMDQTAIKEISKLGLKSKIFTFARAMKTDIDLALECGADGVVIEVPIGYPKLVTQFGWSWRDVAEKTAPIIKYAKENGLHTLFFPYDTTRARKDDLTNLCNYIMDNTPPDSIGIVDTMGCATPEAIKHMVRWVNDMTGLPIEIHTHNDFGMGVATELAAVTAGAVCVHSCANGLGERTGNETRPWAREFYSRKRHWHQLCHERPTCHVRHPSKPDRQSGRSCSGQKVGQSIDHLQDGRVGHGRTRRR